jgi:ribosomal protein S18 acetylase RimI-like enzyme
VTLRQARPCDLRAVVELTRRAYAPYEALLGRPATPVTEDYEPRIAKGEVWLLEDAGELVGLLVLEDEGVRSLVFSVAVAPERRGAGIGRKLLTFAEEIARKRGHRTIALYANARWERNIRIYARFGYRETARRPHPDLADTIVVDMEKQLTSARIHKAS